MSKFLLFCSRNNALHTLHCNCNGNAVHVELLSGKGQAGAIPELREVAVDRLVLFVDVHVDTVPEHAVDLLGALLNRVQCHGAIRFLELLFGAYCAQFSSVLHSAAALVLSLCW